MLRSGQNGGEILDEKWHKALEPKAFVSLIPHYSHSQRQLIKAKQDFNNDRLEYPDLPPWRIKTGKIDKNIQYLNSLAEDIKSSESNRLVKEAYLKRIEELKDLNRLLIASARQDWGLFAMQTDKLYGQIEPAVLAAVCRFLQEKIEGKSEMPGEGLSELLNKGGLLASPAELLLEEDKFNSAKLIFRKRFKSELASLEYLEGRLEAEDIRKVMDEFLSHGQFSGWQAVIAKRRSGPIRIEHFDKHVIIPADKAVTAARLEELAVHEVLTHVLRRYNGEKSRLRLLGIGLNHYLPGEEAVAIFRQELLKDEPQIPLEILIRYFFIALCLGSIDGKPRNFREVYDLAVAFFRSKYSGKKNAVKKAEQRAWNIAVRMFRGVTGEARGVCYTKDLVYLNGYSRLMDTLRKYPDRQMLFDIGKLDVSNEEHITLTRDLEL